MSESGAAAPPAAGSDGDGTGTGDRPWRGGPLAVVKIRPDLPFAARLTAVLALAGLPIGLLWWLLAPTLRAVIAPDGTVVPLSESDAEPFAALILFLVIGSAAGAMVGVGCWFLRRRRGPVALFAVGLGCLASASVAAVAGQALIQARTSGNPGEVVTVTAGVGSPWVVLVQPMIAVLLYTFLAAWNGHDDLGRISEST